MYYWLIYEDEVFYGSCIICASDFNDAIKIARERCLSYSIEPKYQLLTKEQLDKIPKTMIHTQLHKKQHKKLYALLNNLMIEDEEEIQTKEKKGKLDVKKKKLSFW